MSGEAARQRAPQARDKRIDTRFSETELALVERVSRRRGIAPSAFVRGAACAAASTMEGRGPDANVVPGAALPPLTPEQAADFDAARTEVKRSGVVLNELVRASHQGTLDLGALGPVIEDLAEHVAHLISVLGGRATP